MPISEKSMSMPEKVVRELKQKDIRMLSTDAMRKSVVKYATMS